MELGEKLKQARLEAGLSQRQLCGDTITRNMLSQIENGSAKPSMSTLRYLAGRLGKSVSWFLEEDAVISPNLQVMVSAREALEQENWKDLEAALADFRQPDPVFQGEFQLLGRLCCLGRAENALEEGKLPLARQLLEELGPVEEGYCARELERRQLLLLSRAGSAPAEEARLPSLDPELLLRAEAALAENKPERCEKLLEAVLDRESPRWNFLRGEVFFARREFRQAAVCFQKGQAFCPEKALGRLEECYRELGDFRQAYRYACALRDRKGGNPWNVGTII